MQLQGGVSKPLALIACTAMALLYVAILYAPTLVLRLPPPTSFKHYIIRRFICAIISSIISLGVTALILPIRNSELSSFFGVYGIRVDHMWQAMLLPLSLTSAMYAGSMFLKSLFLVDSWREHTSGGGLSFEFFSNILQTFLGSVFSSFSNVWAWRIYIVGPFTEELVFRGCMIPLLLCAGFGIHSIILLCPIFFSLAHLNHIVEIYYKQNFNLIKASMDVGLQLGYTFVFGSYSSFLFIRTGHLIAPLVAHAYCNFMGLPMIFSRRKGIVTVTFVVGLMGFIWLLFPITHPDLYNSRTSNCYCWQGFCSFR